VDQKRARWTPPSQTTPTPSKTKTALTIDFDEDDDLIDEDPPDDEDVDLEDDEDDEPPPPPAREYVEERIKPGVMRRRAKVKRKEEAPMLKQKRERLVTQDDVPREAILTLRTNGHTVIALEIKRKLPSGKWADIRKGILVPPEALFNLGSAVRQLCGGGGFVYTITDPNTREVIAPRWEETYDGMPRATPEDLTIVWEENTRELLVQRKSMTLGVVDNPLSPMLGGPAGGGGYSLSSGLTQGMGVPPMPSQPALPQPQRDLHGNVLPPPPEMVPSWLRTMPAFVQWDHVIRQRSEQQGEPTAQQWVHHEIREQGSLKAQVAQLSAQLQQQMMLTQAQIEKVQQEAAAKIEAEKDARIRAEREVERSREESRTALLQSQIEALRMEISRPKEKEKSLDAVGLVAAAAPIIAAYLGKGSEERRYDLEERRHSQDAQLRFFAELTKKKDDGLLTILKDFGPILAPIVLKWIDNTGPAAYSEALSIEHEQKLMQLKMIYDMLQAQMPDPDPVWKQIMDGLAGMFSPMINRMMLPRPPEPRAPQLTNGVPQQHVDAPTSVEGNGQASAPPQRETLMDRLTMQDPQAAQMVQLVYERLPPELGFHTHEWITIIFNIHAKLDPEELAPKIVSLLTNNEAFGMLPGPFEHVFDSPEAARNAMTTVLGPLPISQQDPNYIAELLELTLEGITEANTDEEEEELPETEVVEVPKNKGRKSRAVVTPAPSS